MTIPTSQALEAIDWTLPLQTNETLQTHGYSPRRVCVLGDQYSGAIDRILILIEGVGSPHHPPGEYVACKNGGHVRGNLAVKNVAIQSALEAAKMALERLSSEEKMHTGVGAGMSPMSEEFMCRMAFARQALADLSHVPEGEGNCFEYGHELHAPFCPACNQEMVKPTPQDGWQPDREAVLQILMQRFGHHTRRAAGLAADLILALPSANSGVG